MIYLDNNATTRVADEVLEAMLPHLTQSYGNPSGPYSIGREAARAVAEARQNVAELLGAASESEIVFTSGGTESDNWAILGALDLAPKKRHIITTRVEHDAVRKLCTKLQAEAYDVTWLDVDSNGVLDLDQLRSALRADTAVVSVMLANNETGILFPIDEVTSIVKDRSNALVHVDGVNAVGKIKIDLKSSEVDLFSLSGHKFYAPKGVGALYIREGMDLPAFAIGGSQERGRRAGTEAVHQVVGLGAAARLVSDLSAMTAVREMRDRLENGILTQIPNTRLNGTVDVTKRLPNTSSISFENTNGEMIMAHLDALGICVSTGSACNSKTRTASPVLAAMDIPYSAAMGSIRFSLGRYNVDADIDIVLDSLPGIIRGLQPR